MTHRCRVILVEDHKLLREFLKNFVVKVDHCSVVAEAKCGIEALNAIRDVEADIVLLDLSLPHVDGIEVLKRTKATLKGDTKFLVVTMHADKNKIQGALEAGADGIFLKDRGPALLEKAILETLEGKHPYYLEKA